MLERKYILERHVSNPTGIAPASSLWRTSVIFPHLNRADRVFLRFQLKSNHFPTADFHIELTESLRSGVSTPSSPFLDCPVQKRMYSREWQIAIPTSLMRVDWAHTVMLLSSRVQPAAKDLQGSTLPYYHCRGASAHMPRCWVLSNRKSTPQHPKL